MKLLLPRCLWLALLLLASTPLALHAQATKIFVASFGNDASDGSRGSPKRNFQPAHDAVATSGEIVVLDTAGYGNLSITKSVSVTVPPGVNGFITHSGSGDAVSINAGAATVNLRGLIINGSGDFAIHIRDAFYVSIDDCIIQGLWGHGIYEGLAASTSPVPKLAVHNCSARACSFGLDLEITANGVSLTASASDCRFGDCFNSAVEAQVSSGATGTIDLTLANCEMSGSNGGVGSDGANATVRVDNCRITGNTFGASTSGGGKILSRGNNTLEKNTNNNTFPGTYSAK